MRAARAELRPRGRETDAERAGVELSPKRAEMARRHSIHVDLLGARTSRAVPFLDGLYLAGHWVGPSGIYNVAVSGRNAAALIAADQGRRPRA